MHGDLSALVKSAQKICQNKLCLNDILACDTLEFVLLRSLGILQKQNLMLNVIVIDMAANLQFGTNNLPDLENLWY